MTDHLNTDPPIPGQTYVAVSFLNPKRILVQKEDWLISKWLQKLREDINYLADGIRKIAEEASNENIKNQIEYIVRNNEHIFGPAQRIELLEEGENAEVLKGNEKTSRSIHEEFQAWKDIHERDLEKEFKSIFGENETSVLGFKVRGVYETVEEAQKRIKKLQEHDENMYDIFLTEMGKWAPWDPSPVAEGGHVEYTEDKLNKIAEVHKDLRKDESMRISRERENARKELEKLNIQKETIEENVSASEIIRNSRYEKLALEAKENGLS